MVVVDVVAALLLELAVELLTAEEVAAAPPPPPPVDEALTVAAPPALDVLAVAVEADAFEELCDADREELASLAPPFDAVVVLDSELAPPAPPDAWKSPSPTSWPQETATTEETTITPTNELRNIATTTSAFNHEMPHHMHTHMPMALHNLLPAQQHSACACAARATGRVESPRPTSCPQEAAVPAHKNATPIQRGPRDITRAQLNGETSGSS